jgi:hypothetical protein
MLSTFWTLDLLCSGSTHLLGLAVSVGLTLYPYGSSQCIPTPAARDCIPLQLDSTIHSTIHSSIRSSPLHRFPPLLCTRAVQVSIRLGWSESKDDSVRLSHKLSLSLCTLSQGRLTFLATVCAGNCTLSYLVLPLFSIPLQFLLLNTKISISSLSSVSLLSATHLNPSHT